MGKTINQKACSFVLQLIILVALNAAIPLMTVENNSLQEAIKKD